MTRLRDLGKVPLFLAILTFMTHTDKRREALAAAQTTYFTGKPCKHGHIAPRYTTSGGCVDCINANNVRTRVAFKEAQGIAVAREQPPPEVLAALQEWRESRAIANARSYPGDVAAIAEYVMWLCVARWPVVPPATFRQTPAPLQPTGAVCLYKFHLHPDDHPAFYAEERRLRNARSEPVRSPFQAEIDRVAAFQRGEYVAPTPEEFNEADESWPAGDPR